MSSAAIVSLAANQPPDRFYAGGSRIAAFRRQPPPGAARPHVPEDWVGSTTTLFGEDRLGLTTLPDGRLLAEAVDADPGYWLGASHVARFGSDAALLVKLLDAGERLPVHSHPDGAFAARHLGLAHGKTEAWIMLEPAVVHLGFRRDVELAELARWVASQDSSLMIAAMHRLEVRRGDAVLVPGGTAHAIGAGAFVVELQEPTDVSVLLEWEGFAIDGAVDGHLGLGHDVALRSVDRRGRSAAQIARLVESGPDAVGELLPGAAPYFRAERWRDGGIWDPGFSVVVVVAGDGTIEPTHGASVRLESGQTWLVPHAAGALRLSGGSELEVLRCRPPAAV